MNEHKSMADPSETPEDVATLYSWANLHGAKYRDFSASRAEAREEARLRVEAARAVEERRLAEEAERKAQEEAQIAARLAAEAAEAAREAEAERLAEIARQAEAERQAVLAAQEAQRHAIQQRGWQPSVNESGITGYGAAGADDGSLSVSLPNVGSFERPTANENSGVASSDLIGSDPIGENDFDDQPQWTVPFPQQERYSYQPPDHNPSRQVKSSDQHLNQGMDRRRYESREPQGPLDWSAGSSVGHDVWNQDSRGERFRFQPEPFSAFNYELPNNESLHPEVSYPHNQTFPKYAHPGASDPTPTGFSENRAPAYRNYPTASPAYDAGAYQPPQFIHDRPRQDAIYNEFVDTAAAQAKTTGAPSSTISKGYGSIQPSTASAWRGSQPPHPTQGPTQRQAPQEMFEHSESVTRPAWLSAEPLSPHPDGRDDLRGDGRAEIRASAVPVQAQYSAGTMATPTNSAHEVQAAQPNQSFQARSALKPNFAAPQQAGYRGASPERMPLLDKVATPVITEDTLYGSRDRIANRWYALKSVFDPHAQVEQAPVQPSARVPAIALFSLAGGVGKTSIIAALGRALSSRGERVLLVDTATYGLLPFFFGARDQRPGLLRTFNPPGASSEAPIQMVTLDPDGNGPDIAMQGLQQDSKQDWLMQEITRYGRGSNRILIDLPTASGATTRRILKLAPVVLVPVVPDMSSVVSVGAIESFFRHSAGGQNQGVQNAQPIMPFYVLNQFDYSLPLHLDVREILQEQIGDRLLPFALRRTPAVSEALAEGMTVIDYAPTANVAEDYASLAGWARSLFAPANVSHRGVRWSER